MSDPIPTPSRQVTCQRAHKAAGLCRYCSRPRWLDTTLCEPCLKRNRENLRRLTGSHEWQPGSIGHCPVERRHERLRRKADAMRARLAAREVVTERMRAKLAKVEGLAEKLRGGVTT